jgi:hypothetical protein
MGSVVEPSNFIALMTVLSTTPSFIRRRIVARERYAHSGAASGLVLDARRTHISLRPWNIIFRAGISGGIRPPLILKESMMTPKFLREEAARFRGMAGTADLDEDRHGTERGCLIRRIPRAVASG